MRKQVIINFSFTQAEAQDIADMLQTIIYNSKRIGFVKDFTHDQMEICREMYRSLVGDLKEKEVVIGSIEGQYRNIG